MTHHVSEPDGTPPVSLDPTSCPACGVSWVGDPTPAGGSYYGSHFTVNVVLVLDEPKYYRCDACGVKTPLTLWNHGYRPEFLADVFLRGFERRGDT